MDFRCPKVNDDRGGRYLGTENDAGIWQRKLLVNRGMIRELYSMHNSIP